MFYLCPRKMLAVDYYLEIGLALRPISLPSESDLHLLIHAGWQRYTKVIKNPLEHYSRQHL